MALTNDQLEKLVQLKDLVASAQRAKDYIDGKITPIEALIGAAQGDADSVINTVREMIDFFAGVPETDTLAAVLLQLNTALNNRYTKAEVDTLLEDTPDVEVIDDDSSDDDSSDDDWEDDAEELLDQLYQALTDAQAVTQTAQQAADNADAKAALANTATGAANDAAALATQKAGLAADAATLAAEKAALAQQKAEYAQQQGAAAQAVCDGAKGDFDSLDARLNYIEQNAGSIDFEEVEDDYWPDDSSE